MSFTPVDGYDKYKTHPRVSRYGIASRAGLANCIPQYADAARGLAASIHQNLPSITKLINNTRTTFCVQQFHLRFRKNLDYRSPRGSRQRADYEKLAFYWLADVGSQ